MEPTEPGETQPSSSHAISSSIHGRFEPGARLGSRYRVVGLLGRGGMGEVYRADDLELNQSVALKFLPERFARSDADLARLRQEVRIARQIAHPNVCRTYDIAEADGQIFVVMEYVDGEDLASVLRRLGRPTTDKAVEIARQLCLGLGAAHESGVLHRDLKPANIMIDGRGRVRITDFGLAVTAAESGDGAGVAGTPAYMAPEQLRTGAATPQSDIFSLGLVLYELFTGKRAVDMALPPDPARSGSDSSVRTPSSIVGEIDPAVERVILRCLERDPARRPQSAYAVYGALPGGDPLAAAVAAGETPSPELVANAGVEGSVRPLWAAMAVIFVVAGFVLTTWMIRPTYEGFGLPPRTLSARADEIVSEVTGRAPPRYTSDGFRYSQTPPDSAAARASGGAKVPARAPAKQYWRRWSPRELVPTDLHGAKALLGDPPQAVPGSATVVLDMAGRMVALSVVPEERSDTTEGSRTLDWGMVLRAARPGTAPPTTVPAQVPRDFVPYADSAAAWQLAPDTTLAAASLRGRLVRVDTFAGRNALGSLAIDTRDRQPGGTDWFWLVAILVVPLVGSVLLARENIKAGRTDRRGAFLVGAWVFVAYMLEHIFATHVGELGLFRVVNTLLDAQPIGHALLHAVTMAVFYLAIEPYVRRLWPSALVSWARLVARRPRDPIIGRDVLAGAVAGTAVVLLGTLQELVTRSLGLTDTAPMIPGPALDAMANVSSVLAILCYAMAISLLLATSVYMLLVLLRFLLRSNRAAATGVVLIAALSFADWTAKSAGIDVFTQVLSFGLLVGVALRFGYLAAITGYFTRNLMQGLIWTGDFHSWIGPTSMFSWAVLGALLAYGFMTAVKGRTLFRDPLRDPVAAPPRRG